MSLNDSLDFKESFKLENLKTEYINIGITFNRGQPAFPEEKNKWPRYFSEIPKDILFDVIYVSESFRVVSCAALYLTHGHIEETKLFVNNYNSRKHYSDIELIWDLRESNGDVAMYSPKPNLNSLTREIREKYSQDSR